MMRHSSLARTLLPILLASVSAAAPAPTLRAGAARIDITPPSDAALPMSGYANRTQGFKDIHDNIHVRAIVLDDGSTQIALVAWELIFVPNPVWAETSQLIARQTGIRPDNLLLAAVHDHGAPSLAGGSAPASPATAAYTKRVQDAAVEAVRIAQSRLQPARFGAGAALAHVNVNRRELSADRWYLGFNEHGVSDKTLTVLRFEDLSGQPIAFLINYPVHAVVMGPENLRVTGDLAGATSRFVEQHYAGQARSRSDGGPRLRLRPEETAAAGVVALWTSGAAGDQNPVAMASGQDFTLVDALGRILGEAAVRVAGGIKTSSDARLSGAQRVVTCPGQRAERLPGAQPQYKFNDADPVNIRIGLWMLGRVALTSVSGEVLTPIALRLKHESPFTQTLMVTHANGSSGYIPDDASYDQVSYEITTSRLKPGCAETEIVNGLLDLMRRQ